MRPGHFLRAAKMSLFQFLRQFCCDLHRAGALSRAEAPHRDTGGLDTLDWGTSGMAHLGGWLPGHQQGVPPEKTSSALARGIRVGALDVAGLQRGDDGDRAGTQGGRERGAVPLQAGAGHLGPTLPGRQVAEGGPGQQRAHSLACRVVPAGKRREKEIGRVRKRSTCSDLTDDRDVIPSGTNFNSSFFSRGPSSSPHPHPHDFDKPLASTVAINEVMLFFSAS